MKNTVIMTSTVMINTEIVGEIRFVNVRADPVL